MTPRDCRRDAIEPAPLAAARARAVALASAAEVLARALPLVHRPHLVERLLHGLEGLVPLPALERLHPLAGVARPVAALAPQPLHLLEQLAQLLRRDLVRPEARGEGLGLAEDHLVRRRGEIGLEIRQAIHPLEELEPLVAPLQEAVEVGPLPGERGVLEDRGEVARGGRPAARALGEVALLERRPLERVLGRRPRPVPPAPRRRAR